MPRASSHLCSRDPLTLRTASWRLISRPAPWQVEANAPPPGTPASTYEQVPIEPGISTGWPVVRRSGGRPGWPGGSAGVAPLRCTHSCVGRPLTSWVSIFARLWDTS